MIRCKFCHELLDGSSSRFPTQHYLERHYEKFTNVQRALDSEFEEKTERTKASIESRPIRPPRR
jgi:hypothetical protein